MHTDAAMQFLPSRTLIGERRVEGAQFNFPSQAAGNRNLDVTDPPPSHLPPPSTLSPHLPTNIHNSPLVMCVLNSAEIYMGTICKFGKGLEQTTRQVSVSRRRPPFLDRTLEGWEGVCAGGQRCKSSASTTCQLLAVAERNASTLIWPTAS